MRRTESILLESAPADLGGLYLRQREIIILAVGSSQRSRVHTLSARSLLRQVTPFCISPPRGHSHTPGKSKRDIFQALRAAVAQFATRYKIHNTLDIAKRGASLSLNGEEETTSLSFATAPHRRHTPLFEGQKVHNLRERTPHLFGRCYITKTNANR